VSTRARAASFPEIRPVAVVSGCAWAIGTNWLGEWYYPFRGIGWGDLFFVAWFLVAFTDKKRRDALLGALWALRIHALLVLMFVTLLLTSTAVNAYRYGADGNDILAICRLLYFSVIVFFVNLVVRQNGLLWVLCGFLAGVGLLALEQLHHAQVSGAVVVGGIIILRDPNVIGNMLGVAVIFCSLGILAGHFRLSVAAAVLFSVASVTTFSKGTWLMVVVGLLANVVAGLMLYDRSRHGFRRFIPVTATIVTALAWLLYVNAQLLADLIRFKLESTMDIESTEYRYRFALAGLYAMTDNPLWGLGFRNYGVVERLYPHVLPEPSENAHNVFLHVGAVAGLPALAALLVLFVYPFIPLWRGTRALFARNLAVIYVPLTFAVFLLSGSLQLQLIAQPFFWVFTGVACGWYAKVRARQGARPQRADVGLLRRQPLE
jgi:O-antigen ligase